MSDPVSLTDLTDISGTPLATNPTIDIGLSFDADSTMPGHVPLTCSTILQAAKTKNRANFKNIYKVNQLQSNVSQFFSQLSSANPAQTITDTSNLAAISEYLNTTRTSQLPVLQLVSDCLTQANDADPIALAKAAAVYETSLSRYEDLTTDHPRVSYYEGWFPIHRPMKLVSMLILFGMGMLFIIMSILFFLQMRGVQIKLEIPAMANSGTSSYIGKAALAGAGIGAIIVAIGLWRKWF